MELKVEINQTFVEANTKLNIKGMTAVITPPLDGDYWIMRVPVSDNQAIVTFPKFMLFGIGFQVEDEDWNTNLPSSCDAEEIYEHIKKNKGDDSISREDCIEAIKMIQRQLEIMEGNLN